MSFEKIALGESGAQAHELLGESNTEMAILVVQEWWGINYVVLSHARELRDRLGATVLVDDTCNSYFQDPSGRITTQWPGFMYEYRRLPRRIKRADYEFA